jgi:hypothetical protein
MRHRLTALACEDSFFEQFLAPLDSYLAIVDFDDIDKGL